MNLSHSLFLCFTLHAIFLSKFCAYVLFSKLPVFCLLSMLYFVQFLLVCKTLFFCNVGIDNKKNYDIINLN